MRKISIVLITAVLLTSCVSKKKYVALEEQKSEQFVHYRTFKARETDLKSEDEIFDAEWGDIQNKNKFIGNRWLEINQY